MIGHNAQLDIKKHGCGMMLVIVLVRSKNYGRSGNSEIQEMRSIWKQRAKLRRLFTRKNLKGKGKLFRGTLYRRMIKTVTC